ncbi:MAG: hypothetical protein ACR2J8_16060 [Thermomicrobiales bacterium]
MNDSGIRAAAANTPVACVIMGAELFGNGAILYGGIAIFIAYTISGHRGIYHSQRLLASRFGRGREGDTRSTLRDWRDR